MDTLSTYNSHKEGLGVETLERLELWYRQIWKESPMFVLYQAEDFVIYCIQEKTTVYQQLGQVNSIIIPKENIQHETNDYTDIILQIGEIINVKDVDSLGKRSYG
ncbi:9816_t:CDS:2, partial [Funneliformis mosseae]